jgi:hypothetical protein
MKDDWKPVKTAALGGAIFSALESLGVLLAPVPLDPVPSFTVIVVSLVCTSGLLGLVAALLSGVSRRHAAAFSLALWSAVWGPHQARLAGDHRVGWLPTVALVGTSLVAPGAGVALGSLGGLTGSLVRKRRARQGLTPMNRKVVSNTTEMPNILLITVDTVRADAGLLNDGRWKADSPFSPMRGWTHFAQAIAPAPWTLPSMHSVLSSMPVRSHGGGLPTAIGNSRRVPDSVPFPYVLQQAGYETVAVISNPHLSIEHGFADGFDHWMHSDQSAEPLVLMRQWTRWKEKIMGPVSELRHTRDERIVRQAVQEIQTVGNRPRFLWVHLLSPHEYGRDPATPVEGWEPGTTDPDVLMGSYEANIIATRQHLRRLTSLAEGWVIAVTSDHGEAMGEAGRWGHGHRLDDIELRVPMAIRRPGTNGGVVPGAVAVSDLAHTLLASAGEARGFPGHNLYARRAVPIEVGGVRGDGNAFAARRLNGHYVDRKADVVGPGVKNTDEVQENLKAIGYTN